MWELLADGMDGGAWMGGRRVGMLQCGALSSWIVSHLIFKNGNMTNSYF